MKVLKSVPVPQPQGGSTLQLAVHLLGGAANLHVRLYSSAYALIYQGDAPGPWVAGWSLAAFKGLPEANGIFYYVLEAERAGQRVPSPPQRLVRLR